MTFIADSLETGNTIEESGRRQLIPVAARAPRIEVTCWCRDPAVWLGAGLLRITFCISLSFTVFYLKHILFLLLKNVRVSQRSGTGIARPPLWGRLYCADVGQFSVASNTVTVESLSQEGLLRIKVHLCLLRIN